MFKKLLMAGAATALVAAPAAARDYRYDYHRHGGGDALAVGLLGAVAGAAIASSVDRHYDNGYGYGYGYPAYNYGYPAYAYAYPNYNYGYGYPAYGYAYPSYGYGYGYGPSVSISVGSGYYPNYRRYRRHW